MIAVCRFVLTGLWLVWENEGGQRWVILRSIEPELLEEYFAK